MDADYERVILVKPEVFMYKIPPRVSNRAYRATEWNLEHPDWNGRMRILSVGPKCMIKLEDKNTGELFAACPVDAYPSPAVESVSDSARYFVLRIRDESGRSAFIGIGFIDRSDSFDFNVALQDHFKYLKKDEELAKAPPLEAEKKLDLSFKEGQTIKINIGKKSETTMGTSRPKPQMGSGPILLPPPPSSKSNTATSSAAANKPVIGAIKPPGATASFGISAAATTTAHVNKPAESSQAAASNLLLDFDMPSSSIPSKPAAPSTSSSTTGSANTASLLDLDF